MAPNPSNSSNLERLALKGLSWNIQLKHTKATNIDWSSPDVACFVFSLVGVAWSDRRVFAVVVTPPAVRCAAAADDCCRCPTSLSMTPTVGEVGAELDAVDGPPAPLLELCWNDVEHVCGWCVDDDEEVQGDDNDDALRTSPADVSLPNEGFFAIGGLAGRLGLVGNGGLWRSVRPFDRTTSTRLELNGWTSTDACSGWTSAPGRKFFETGAVVLARTVMSVTCGSTDSVLAAAMWVFECCESVSRRRHSWPSGVPNIFHRGSASNDAADVGQGLSRRGSSAVDSGMLPLPTVRRRRRSSVCTGSTPSPALIWRAWRSVAVLARKVPSSLASAADCVTVADWDSSGPRSTDHVSSLSMMSSIERIRLRSSTVAPQINRLYLRDFSFVSCVTIMAIVLLARNTQLLYTIRLVQVVTVRKFTSGKRDVVFASEWKK